MPNAIRRAHVFVERDRLMLVLQQSGGLRWWECPGGDLEAGEEPAQAAVREETGLEIGQPDLLRKWQYINRRGDDVDAYAFAARAASGDVMLSSEHSDFVWMLPNDYARRYCPQPPDSAEPWLKSFMQGMRENGRLFDEWLARQSA
jgi:8-oxo-dGTP diphosphatase